MKYGNWVMVGTPQPAAPARLFCFPYAGAGASVFRDWQSRFHGRVEVVGIQLPGRESRFSEPRCNRLVELMPVLSRVVSDMADRPFYFFGHSMGALIAFELARALRERGLPQPFHVVVSGMRAPQWPRREKIHHKMNDADLLQAVAAYNGTPREVLEHPELMQLLLPLMRDDFAILETYEYTQGAPLNYPLTALGARDDPNVPPEALAAWVEQAGSGFEERLFSGDHFFIHPHKQAIIDLLVQVMTRGLFPERVDV
ncbi:MAG TPA: alpha/beta fold hydrolase [Dyella sp.]|uniref:thioesterase II family protein n=1 Tax=Dyella sp. TaxID=1869338 RepID=UPI002F9525BA